LVTGNYFGYHDEILSIDSISSDNTSHIYESKDYFIFDIKSKSKFSYICDISASDSFMDRKRIIELFSRPKRIQLSNSKDKGFPYK
jgi:hypothetical protein